MVAHLWARCTVTALIRLGLAIICVQILVTCTQQYRCTNNNLYIIRSANLMWIL